MGNWVIKIFSSRRRTHEEHCNDWTEESWSQSIEVPTSTTSSSRAGEDDVSRTEQAVESPQDSNPAYSLSQVGCSRLPLIVDHPGIIY